MSVLWLRNRIIVGCLWCCIFNLSFAETLPDQGVNFGNNIKFDRYLIDDGLSQNSIKAIAQDKNGFIWLGTQDGLNRFDGYTFRVYRHQEDVKNSLSDNYVESLFVDSSGLLWVGGVNGGVSSYDSDSDKFTHYDHPMQSPKSHKSGQIQRIVEDSKQLLWFITHKDGVYSFDKKSGEYKRYHSVMMNAGAPNSESLFNGFMDDEDKLWLAYSDAGLGVFDTKTGQYQHFNHDPNDPSSLSHDDVNDIFKDSKGRLWIATGGGGINLFQADTRSFRSYRYRADDPGSLSSDSPNVIVENHKGQLWIGTEDDGVMLFDPETGQSLRYRHKAADPYGIGSNRVYSLFIDRDKNVWVGLGGGGINVHDPIQSQFSHHYNIPADKQSISSNNVLSIHVDGHKTLWLGFHGGGLNRYDPMLGEFVHYTHDKNDPNSLSNNLVLSIAEGKDNSIWLATYGGLDRYLPESDSFKHYRHDPADPNSLSGDKVYSVISDRQGQIWIGTTSGGLHRYKPESDSFESYLHNPNDPNTLGFTFISALYADSKNRIWVGSFGGGLDILDINTGQFTHYRHDENIESSLSDNKVTSINEDRHGNIWVTTYGGGINLFLPSNNSFKRVRKQDGLADDVTYRIMEANNGELWISTNSGLSVYNVERNSFRHFSKRDGLQSNEFNLGASFQSPSGEMYFGGVNGFNRFFPENITSDERTPNLRFTNMELFNNPVAVSSTALMDKIRDQKGIARKQRNNDVSREFYRKFYLDENIFSVDRISLSHSESVVSFEFSSLYFSSPKSSKYAYKLEGFDEGWVYTDYTRRHVTYTNIEPGSYVLKAKAANKNGVWGQESSIQINVAPPPWKSLWAYTFYALILCLALAVYRRQRILAIRAEERRLAAEEANAAKSNFLATMSHEIRTPINGVIGAANLLAQAELNSQLKDFTNIIQVSGENLLYIVNDILDLSKIEAGKLGLEPHKFSLTDCVEGAIDLFMNDIQYRDLDLLFITDDSVPEYIFADSTRIRQVLVNLIGNSVKFTERGSVVVLLSCTSNENKYLNLEFIIRDTGLGISSEKIERMFNAFEQADSSTSREFGGTGLGLTISKRLATFMGGDITIRSELNKGTDFIFTTIAESVDGSVCVNDLAVLPELSQKNILLVEKNTYIHQAFKTIARRFEVNLDIENSAKEALAGLIERISNKEDKPDLIVVGYYLDSMTGIEFAESMRKAINSATLSIRIPLVLICSHKILYENEDDVMYFFSRVINKPIKAKSIVDAITSVLCPEDKAEEVSLVSKSDTFCEEYPASVLIAEDNAVIQKLLMHTFAHLGYSPDIVSNGLEAVHAVQEREYDILITDYQMPELDGLEVAKCVKSIPNREKLIVLLSSADVLSDMDSWIEKGIVDGLLYKPVTLQDVKNAMSEWCSKNEN